MRSIGLFIFLFPLVVLAQRKDFFHALDTVNAEPVNTRSYAGDKIDVLHFNEANYAGIVLDYLNTVRNRKGRKAFEQDESFNRLCRVGMAKFSKNYFRGNKYEHQAVRYSEFSLRYLNAEHRLFKVFTFEVNLTHLNQFTRFYYLRDDHSTDLKLFLGKRPKITNPEHEGYEEPKPVKVISEFEFVSRVLKKIRSRAGVRDIYSKNYSHIGLDITIDEYTVHRKKIPKAKVMVVLGGKQLQKVRERKLHNTPKKDEDNPYRVF